MAKPRKGKTSLDPELNLDWAKEAEQPQTQEEVLSPEVMAKFAADPETTLRAFGKVMGQEEGKSIDWSTDAVCPPIAKGITSYVARAPTDADGYIKILTVLSARQTTKSATAALCAYVQTAYRPGTQSYIVADFKDRAAALFKNVTHLHREMPSDVRAASIPSSEIKQLTFKHGSTLQLRSGDQDNVGIGLSPDFLHISEAPFWGDVSDFWSKALPSFRNRKNAYVIIESTPAPQDEPSTEWFVEHCDESRRMSKDPRSRHAFLFVPYYQSWLNERNWDPKANLTSEEEKMLRKYGPPPGAPENALHLPRVPWLTYRNLAFRRETIILDKGIKKNPALFDTYYPINPVTCWGAVSGGPIPKDYIDRLAQQDLVPWEPDVNGIQRYIESPRPGARYVIGIDPAGWTSHGNGDQASFQILEVWSDRVEQAAVFSSSTSTPKLVVELVVKEAQRYNQPIIICEKNGVGEAAISYLQDAANAGLIKNLWYKEFGFNIPPGVHSGNTTLDQALSLLVELMEKQLYLHDQETFEQLRTYKNDKAFAPSRARQLSDPENPGKGKRARHHWDRVSALLWAAYATRYPNPMLGLRPCPHAERDTNVRIVSASEMNRLTLMSARAALHAQLVCSGKHPAEAARIVARTTEFKLRA